MSWWGKIIGGAFGFAMGGPIGALLGAAIGHQFDAGLERVAIGDGFSSFGGNRERTQTAFFTAVFSVMGHMAKADGRVSETEIAMARTMMQKMALNEAQSRVAIDLFNKGKQADFPLDDVLEQFRQECHRRRTLIQMFIEILLHSAYADGSMHPDERRLLLHICDRLHIPRHQFEQLEEMVRAQRFFHEGGAARGAPRKDIIKEAYAALGVSESASDAEVKKAYRRLMNQHHPDKLVSKGLPEEMIKIANEKTYEIRAAYETIRKARGS